MHAHLANEKQLHCSELIQQLNECHSKGFVHKFTGGCNEIKLALNACLHDERMKRTERNREASKANNAEKRARWKEIDENR